jgi:hypothetical protein
LLNTLDSSKLINHQRAQAIAAGKSRELVDTGVALVFIGWKQVNMQSASSLYSALHFLALRLPFLSIGHHGW